MGLPWRSFLTEKMVSVQVWAYLPLSLLGPLLLLHQATMCLFHAHCAHWFSCFCVPSAHHTAQHTARVSLEQSWVTRETQGRWALGGRVLESLGKEAELGRQHAALDTYRRV